MNFEIKTLKSIRTSNKNSPSGERNIATNDESPAPHHDAEALQKYQMIFAELALPDVVAEPLKLLLARREQALEGEDFAKASEQGGSVRGPQHQQILLAAIDQEIAAVLNAEQYARFELFRDSDLEQYQLTRFKTCLTANQSLTEAQSAKLLLAKLTHKAQFLDRLAEANQIQKTGGNQSVRLSIEQAVRQYHRSYLDVAKTVLDEQQWRCLADFETSEFEDIYLVSLSST